MYRKIIVNGLVAFVVFPVIISFRYWQNIIEGNYKYYDSYIDSFSEYVYIAVLRPMAYPLVPIFFLLLVLLPFQLIKDHYYKIGKTLPYYKKILLFSLIVGSLIIFWGLFSNIWVYPYYHNLIYLVYAFGSGVIYGSLLYFLVDRYVEKTKEDHIT